MLQKKDTKPKICFPVTQPMHDTLLQFTSYFVKMCFFIYLPWYFTIKGNKNTTKFEVHFLVEITYQLSFDLFF